MQSFCVNCTKWASYLDYDITVEYLTAAGFKDGDIVLVKDEDSW